MQTKYSLSLIAAATLGCLSLANASTYTWQTSGTNSTWSTNAGDANWYIDAGTTLSGWTDNNSVVFGNGTPGSSIILGSAVTATGITFDTDGYTLVKGAGGQINLAANSTVTANVDATLQGISIGNSASTWTKSGAGKLTLNDASLSGALVAATNFVVSQGTVSLTGTGFNSFSGQSTTTVTVGAGATLSADKTAGNANTIGYIALSGGTLTSTAGAANDGGFGNWILNGTTTNTAVAVTGTGPSTISSTTLTLKDGVRKFDVASTASLNVSSSLLGNAAATLSKENTGKMTITSTTGTPVKNSAGYAGKIDINAGTLEFTGSVAYAGTGAITVNNGGTLNLNRNGGAIASANITVNNGGLLITGTYNGLQNYSGTSTVTINSGAVATNNNGLGTYWAQNMTGNLVLAGGEWAGAKDANGFSWAFSKDISVTGGTTSTFSATDARTSTGVINVGTGSNLNFTGSIATTSTDFTKSGAGTMTLSGTSALTAAVGKNVVVSAGTLVLAGGSIGNATVVNSGATLTGAGSITSGMTVAGTLAPGNIANLTVGSLTIASNVELQNTSVLEILLKGGGISSSLIIGGSQNLLIDNGALLHFTLDSGAPLLGNETFNIITGSGTLTGVFANLANGSTTSLGGHDYLATYSASGLTLTAIPEPSTYALLAGIAGMAIIGIRRRQKRRL